MTTKTFKTDYDPLIAQSYKRIIELFDQALQAGFSVYVSPLSPVLDGIIDLCLAASQLLQEGVHFLERPTPDMKFGEWKTNEFGIKVADSDSLGNPKQYITQYDRKFLQNEPLADMFADLAEFIAQLKRNPSDKSFMDFINRLVGLKQSYLKHQKPPQTKRKESDRKSYYYYLRKSRKKKRN